MFSSVDDLSRWNKESCQLRDDEVQGFTNITNASSACLGSSVLILPSYFGDLANHLRTIDWKIPAQTIIDAANAEVVMDRTKANVYDVSWNAK